MQNDKTVKKFVSSGGVVVYKLPVEAFPNHVTNCYLVMTDPITLLDSASGWETANNELVNCFAAVKEQFGESVALKDVGRVIVTHGHIDHFGGIGFVTEQSGAELGIHELDVSTIRHFKERLLVSATNIHRFLNRTGMSKEQIKILIDMNKWSKDTFKAREVDFDFDEGLVADGPLTAYHMPGHCPGQVCLQLDDLLFTADHVLSHVTPNQSPEAITRWTGLGHYMKSLRKVSEIEGISLGLGGHEDEIEDVCARAQDTLSFHDSRLDKTLGLLNEPTTIHAVSQGLFGRQKEYHVLLAMMETGAHMEYLYERGEIVTTNFEEVSEDLNAVPLYSAV